MTPREIVDRLLGDRRALPPRELGVGRAPANIALCKYWGKRDAALNLPRTSSLSVSLGPLGSTVALRAGAAAADTVRLNGQPLAPDAPFVRRLSGFLDLFRPTPATHFQVEAENSIPTAAGFASSASGFAAVVLALDALFGWQLDRRALSILARLGSGSACRSLYPGLVEWHAGTAADGMDSYAEPLAAGWPGLRLGLLVISAAEKPVGSRPAMQRTVESSPLYAAWPAAVARDLAALKAAVAARDFAALGATAEANALTMHATMMAARPAVLYWLPESLAAMRSCWQLRAQGVEVYFTMDAGPNLKLLFEAGAETAVLRAFAGMQVVRPFEA